MALSTTSLHTIIWLSWLALCCGLAIMIWGLVHLENGKANDRLCPGRANELGFVGNPDFYGLDIRLGIYLQWLAQILADTAIRSKPDLYIGLFGANVVFALALTVAVLVLTFGRQCAFTAEIILIIFMTWGHLLSSFGATPAFSQYISLSTRPVELSLKAPQMLYNKDFKGLWHTFSPNNDWLKATLLPVSGKHPRDGSMPRVRGSSLELVLDVLLSGTYFRAAWHDIKSGSASPRPNKHWRIGSSLAASIPCLVMEIFSFWFRIRLATSGETEFVSSPGGTFFFLFTKVNISTLPAVRFLVAVCAWLALFCAYLLSIGPLLLMYIVGVARRQRHGSTETRGIVKKEARLSEPTQHITSAPLKILDDAHFMAL